MLSIYVYLLWGWRQQELSNTFVKCLEDLRIKLKPAEVSCKSCCASLGARIVYLVLVTMKYSSWKTWERSVLLTSLGSGSSSLSRRLQQRFYRASGYCSSAVTARGWISLCLPGHAYSTTGAGSRQSLGTSPLLPPALQELWSQREVRSGVCGGTRLWHILLGFVCLFYLKVP